MQFTLNNTDVQKAIVAHVQTLGLNLTDRKVGVTLVAGRKGAGATAIVSIDEDSAPAAVAATPVAKTKAAKSVSGSVSPEPTFEAQVPETEPAEEVVAETSAAVAPGKSLFGE